MNVLITGAAGFIGSHVADALLEQGHKVWGIDNFETGLPGNVDSDVRFAAADLCDDDAFDKLLADANPDVIVHAAATYRDPDAWHRDIAVNADATAMIADRAAALGAHLVYFQTSLCYGTCPPHPIAVGYPLAPQSSYAISKTAGERYIHLSGADAAVLRLANMYGPRNLSGPAPAFWKRLDAGEECVLVDARRDFVYVADLVRLVLRAIDDRACGIWHASSGGDMPVAAVFDQVVAAGGFEKPKVRRVARGSDDVATLLLDATATHDRFGWHPEVGLPEGVAAAVGWYEQNGVVDTYTHLKVAT